MNRIEIEQAARTHLNANHRKPKHGYDYIRKHMDEVLVKEFNKLIHKTNDDYEYHRSLHLYNKDGRLDVQMSMQFSAQEGCLYLHPLLDNVYFTTHSLDRVNERSHEIDVVSEMRLIDRTYVCGTDTALDKIVCIILSRERYNDLGFVKYEKGFTVGLGKFGSIGVRRKGPMYLVSTYLAPGMKKCEWGSLGQKQSFQEWLFHVFKKEVS